MKKKTLFGTARSKTAAKIIRTDTPNNAITSIHWLSIEWEKAKTRNRRVKLVRYATEAANRAGVIASNNRVSPDQRVEARKVAEFYNDWKDAHAGKE